MECWYVLWSIVKWEPPYLVLVQWDNGDTGIITLTLHFVLVFVRITYNEDRSVIK